MRRKYPVTSVWTMVCFPNHTQRTFSHYTLRGINRWYVHSKCGNCWGCLDWFKWFELTWSDRYNRHVLTYNPPTLLRVRIQRSFAIHLWLTSTARKLYLPTNLDSVVQVPNHLQVHHISLTKLNELFRCVFWLESTACKSCQSSISISTVMSCSLLVWTDLKS